MKANNNHSLSPSRMAPLHLTLAVSLVILASLSNTSAQKKWVWGESRRSGGSSFQQDIPQGDYSIAKPIITPGNGNPDFRKGAPLFQAADNPRTDAKFFRDPAIKDNGRPRYQVFEGGNEEPVPSGGSYPPLPPVRPGPFPPEQPPIRPNRPPIPRPPLPPPGPGGIPPINPARPPNDPEAGILTGPVPSWEQPQPPKNGDPTSFDSCKCVHSFNCKSPGLQFGNCDVGKQYCCYNNPGYGLQSEGGHLGPLGGFGSKFGPNDADIPPVLAGPGGPVDNIRPNFPGFQGGHQLRPGLPPPPPPFHDPRNRPYNGFGRSNNPDKQ